MATVYLTRSHPQEPPLKHTIFEAFDKEPPSFLCKSAISISTRIEDFLKSNPTHLSAEEFTRAFDIWACLHRQVNKPQTFEVTVKSPNGNPITFYPVTIAESKHGQRLYVHIKPDLSIELSMKDSNINPITLIARTIDSIREDLLKGYEPSRVI
jgi:hypothetical protein